MKKTMKFEVVMEFRAVIDVKDVPNARTGKRAALDLGKSYFCYDDDDSKVRILPMFVSLGSARGKVKKVKSSFKAKRVKKSS